jgi:hypothetical protein
VKLAQKSAAGSWRSCLSPRRTLPSFYIDHREKSKMRKFSSDARLLAFLLSAISLLTMVGCNGGYEGFPHTAPAITVQPSANAILAGQTATFTVVATGAAPLSYQWMKNGVPISGANSSTYTITATSMSDNGSTFSVIVTNSVGSATSVTFTLTVNPGTPVATSLVPSSATPPYNSSVTLVPTFSGGTAVIGSAGVGSSDISSSATSGGSYPTPPLTSAKTYTLTVTGSTGTVTSTTVTVTPANVTLSSISPANQTFAPAALSFTAVASGGATNHVNWTASAGSFSGNVWTPPNVAGTYTIQATSADEPSVFTTTSATISAPIITTQPVSMRICTAGTATLSVAANYATSIQWKLNGTSIPGATNSTFVISNASSLNAGNYTVTVSNGISSVTSAVATVLVGSTITSNPISLSVLATQTATFSVAASGMSPFSFQWYQIPSGGSATLIPGATSSTYTTPAVDLTYNNSQYYATVGDSCGGSPLTSTSATLTVNSGSAPPTILVQPLSETVAPGGTTSFSVTASGSPTLTYQWYRIPAGQVTGTSISGAVTSTYNVPSSSTNTSNDQDAYYVEVSNSAGQAVSQHAILAVGAGITITSQPQTAFVNTGESATYSVSATSSLPLSYQWYVANPGSSTFNAISGATSSTYTLNNTVSTETGSVYKVVVSNGSTASVTSGTAGLFVGALSQLNSLCNTSWQALGNASFIASPCSFQLTPPIQNQHGEIIWPSLISTGDIDLSFTITVSNTSSPPADGFTMVLGDPSLGATPTSLGATGSGIGAQGIPGFVLAFDTYRNAGDPPVPYLGVGRSETALWENPWINVNTNIPAIAVLGSTISHNYTVDIVQGQMTVTMDGTQVFSGAVSVPPVAYFYITASTGGLWELPVISNLSATVLAPSN